MKTCAILGASGYTGAEMIRLVMGHSKLNLVALTGERYAGQSSGQTHPGLRAYDLPDIVSVEDVGWEDVDIAFCCLPHGASQSVIARVAPHVECVIDLSADFRLEDADLYAETYGLNHDEPDLLASAVYGLTEWARDDLPSASLVACPGCFPTCVLLALGPLVERGIIDSEDIRIAALTGVSGAGRKATQAFAFSELHDSAHPYGLGGHRHAPEMEQFLSNVSDDDVKVSFVPQLVPMNRGMVATVFVTHDGDHAQLHQALKDRYGEEPFVHVLPEGKVPRTRDVRGSNRCVMNIFPDRIEGRAILVSAIDNLTKGSSGQALQNCNVVMGWEETLGLEMPPLFP